VEGNVSNQLQADTTCKTTLRANFFEYCNNPNLDAIFGPLKR
jgi:hypothetical protein